MATAEAPRRGRLLRLLLIVLAIVVLVPVAAIAWSAATFDLNAYKPRIEAAVKRATGRDLALNGPLGLKLSFWPTIEARDAALANAPGGSRPEMATLARLEAQVALLPLLRHRVEIERLVLVRPDILFETDSLGRPNWIFTSKPAPAVAQAETTATKPNTPVALAVHEFTVEDGTITYRDGRTGHVTTIAVNRAEATSGTGADPVRLDVQAATAGHPFTLSGETGSLARLEDPAARTPWPVRLTLTGKGARLGVDGSLTEPMLGRGYQAKLDGAIPDLAALNAYFTHAGLPPLHEVVLTATVKDTGGALPEVSGAALSIGESDLSSIAPGFKLTGAELSASGLDKPVLVASRGTLGTAAFSLSGTLGPAQLLLPNPPAATYPVDVTLEAAGAKLSARGTIADPRTLTGADLDVTAHLPDLAALSAAAQRPLPALRDVDFQARLADGAGGFRDGAILRALQLTLPQGDLSGDLAMAYAGRPSLRANLSARHIDADALAEALAAKSPGQSAPGAVGQPPSGAAGSAAPPPTPPPRPAALPAKQARVFSDNPLPFSLLRLADADVRLGIGALRSGGADYRDIAFHLMLAGGKLDLQPFTATLPAGRLEARLSADASQATPAVALILRGPSLQLGPLLALIGEPEAAEGPADVDLDLHGAGETPHALAASASGHLGIAMVNGAIDNRVISETLGEVLQHARLPEVMAHAGRTAVRCLAIRADTHTGTADLRTFLLDTPLFYVEGDGTLNLVQETMALRLRPLARLGGTGVILPLRVDGPFRAPKVEVDASGVAGEAAGLAAQASRSPQLGIIIGALGGDRMVKGAGGDSCPAALASARGGLPGPAPAPLPSAAPKPPKPADLLRQLLR